MLENVHFLPLLSITVSEVWETMPKIPFTIRCTTCEAKLLVRNTALVGHVLACPKCGSMVHIEAPKDNPEKERPENSTANTPLFPQTPPPVSPEPESEENTADDTEGEPLIRSRMYQTKEQRLRKTTIIVLLVVIAILALVYVAVLMNSDSTPDTESLPVAKKLDDPITTIKPASKGDEDTENNDADKIIADPNPLDESVGDSDSVDDPEFVDEPIDDPGFDTETETDQQITEDPQPNNTHPIFTQPIRKLEQIDVAQRLKLPTLSTRIDRIPFIIAVRTLSEFSGIPLTIDVPSLRLHGINIREPIRMDFGGSTVADVLLEILTKNKLTFIIEYGQITIYPSEKDDPTIREIRYDITDIVRAAEAPGQILSISDVANGVKNLVEPQSWSGNDSEACSISTQGTLLVVKQTAIGHIEVLRLLEQIRLVRNLPLKTQTSPNSLNAERLGWEMVRGPITLHHYTPMPVADLFASVERFTGLQILLDNRTLNEMQVPLLEIQATVNVEKGNIKQVIEQILDSVEQLELAYRIVDYDTIFITTFESAAQPENFSLESHYFGKFLENQSGISSAEDLADTIMKTIEPKSWTKSEIGEGAILIDPVSQTFFIRQSQPIQRVIRNWIDSQLDTIPADDQPNQ